MAGVCRRTGFLNAVDETAARTVGALACCSERSAGLRLREERREVRVTRAERDPTIPLLNKVLLLWALRCSTMREETITRAFNHTPQHHAPLSHPQPTLYLR